MKTLIETQPCLYSDSLLFQFILTELLHTYKEMNALEVHLEKLKTVSLTPKAAVKSFSDLFIKAPSIYNFQLQQETLAKFKNYVLSFQQDNNQKDLRTLKNQARKGWLLSVALTDIAENSSSLKAFEKTFIKLSKVIQSFKNPILKLIPQFRHDENVLFFLLSHQQPLDSLFGTSFTLDQIKLMHTSLEQGAKFLLNSYAKRKFDQLLPIITKKLAALELSE